MALNYIKIEIEPAFYHHPCGDVLIEKIADDKVVYELEMIHARKGILERVNQFCVH